jgi:hypothetical protein
MNGAVFIRCNHGAVNEVPNSKKQITAKGTWARMSGSNRPLREALETIGALAGDAHIQDRAGEGVRYLRLIHEMAVAVLAHDDQEHRAA